MVLTFIDNVENCTQIRSIWATIAITISV